MNMYAYMLILRPTKITIVSYKHLHFKNIIHL
ncbi:hypothetical protein Dbac_1880 [Desulfomicrobium baculatum DSM 4028]|uniref:Uncharacterized protein n=1 Tax=Desulfomicrobium baculatum (strain DSM 4028 / VKM B-1378 / X) TaxID=525897 RepID=C7LXA0_DESBD|nr:hypothetical protein Dbac_1880 [Desulfomicrobium baculatum DSM 4028]